MAQEEALDTELTATRFNHKEFQLQRKNHFEVQFNSGTGLDSNFKYMVVSFPLPKETTESSDINYFNTTVKVAGKTTFDNTTMVIRDAIDYDSETKFLEWRKRVYDPKTGKMGIAEDYKYDAVVTEWTPNKTGTGRKWKLVGCWPSSIDYGDMSYDDGGEKQISIGITYDFAYRMD